MKDFKKNDPKVINGWAMYDWANSVYSLVITSTIFPIYYSSVTKAAYHGSDVIFLGIKIDHSVLYSYAISFSFLIVAFLSPILSGIADYSGNKKGFMKFFAYLGSISCAALYFFEGENVVYGIACSIMASIGFAGSIVFYNSFLPEIVTEDKYDAVSAKGFSLGYIGSVILMIANLIMVLKWKEIGIPSVGLASKLSFVSVGIWWAGFSQITFARLPQAVTSNHPKQGLLYKGFNELKKVWHQLGELPNIKKFLWMYFFTTMGVQTIMYMAAIFGSDQLHLPDGILITTILVIQLVAILGAQFFAYVSKKNGNIFAISIMIPIWCLICIGAYFVKDQQMFIVLATVVGLVMGGIQSMCRSTYSKLLPVTKDHASFFSFYDVVEKLGIVLGTFVYGLTAHLSGDMRNSVWPLLLCFIVSFFLIRTIKLQSE